MVAVLLAVVLSVVVLLVVVLSVAYLVVEVDGTAVLEEGKCKTLLCHSRETLIVYLFVYFVTSLCGILHLILKATTY